MSNALKTFSKGAPFYNAWIRAEPAKRAYAERPCPRLLPSVGMNVWFAGCRRLVTWVSAQVILQRARIGRSWHKVEDVVSGVPQEAVAF